MFPLRRTLVWRGWAVGQFRLACSAWSAFPLFNLSQGSSLTIDSCVDCTAAGPEWKKFVFIVLAANSLAIQRLTAVPLSHYLFNSVHISQATSMTYIIALYKGAGYIFS